MGAGLRARMKPPARVQRPGTSEARGTEDEEALRIERPVAQSGDDVAP